MRCIAVMWNDAYVTVGFAVLFGVDAIFKVKNIFLYSLTVGYEKNISRIGISVVGCRYFVGCSSAYISCGRHS